MQLQKCTYQFSLLLFIKIKNFFSICVSCHPLHDISKTLNYYRVTLSLLPFIESNSLTKSKYSSKNCQNREYFGKFWVNEFWTPPPPNPIIFCKKSESTQNGDESILDLTITDLGPNITDLGPNVNRSWT